MTTIKIAYTNENPLQANLVERFTPAADSQKDELTIPSITHEGLIDQDNANGWEIATNIAVIVTLGAYMLLGADPALAYKKGEIMAKAQPIIDLMKDAAEPIGYGCYIWGFIKYMLGQRGEGIQLIKGTTWAFIGIQVIPWLMSIIKSIGA